MLGEQGRSFRSFVVATEVRNIVCRTQQSIKEILEMMGNLQSGSQHASVALQEVVAPFAEKSLQIAIVAAEQTVVSYDTYQRINMIEQIGSELRSLVEETEQATLSLNQLSLELYHKVARFEVQ